MLLNVFTSSKADLVSKNSALQVSLGIGMAGISRSVKRRFSPLLHREQKTDFATAGVCLTAANIVPSIARPPLSSLSHPL